MGLYKNPDALSLFRLCAGAPAQVVCRSSSACGEGYFRFSMFGSPEDTAEAARRLEALLAE